MSETEQTKKKRALQFVVQKHRASHLHYGFRLEVEGVLKSWVIPKGPSMDSTVKRLAIMVEDHPYDYRNFEGVIPTGYGAGSVLIWDQGSYSVNEEPADESEKEMLTGLQKGHLHFILNGKKLKGEFSLVKLHNQTENQWLLIKKNDQFSADLPSNFSAISLSMPSNFREGDRLGKDLERRRDPRRGPEGEKEN